LVDEEAVLGVVVASPEDVIADGLHEQPLEHVRVLPLRPEEDGGEVDGTGGMVLGRRGHRPLTEGVIGASTLVTWPSAIDCPAGTGRPPSPPNRRTCRSG